MWCDKLGHNAVCREIPQSLAKKCVLQGDFCSWRQGYLHAAVAGAKILGLQIIMWGVIGMLGADSMA